MPRRKKEDGGTATAEPRAKRARKSPDEKGVKTRKPRLAKHPKPEPQAEPVAPVEDGGSQADPSTAEFRSPVSRVCRRVAESLKQISDPTRLLVVSILSQGEYSVGALCEAVGQNQPAVSHHLALLRMGRVVECRRDGKQVLYSLTDEGRGLAAVAATLGV